MVVLLLSWLSDRIFSGGIFWWASARPLFFVCVCLSLFSQFLYFVVREREKGGVASIFGNAPFSDAGVLRFSFFFASDEAKALWGKSKHVPGLAHQE